MPTIESLRDDTSGWIVNDVIVTKNLSSSLPQNQLSGLLGIDSAQLTRSSYLLVFLKVRGSIDCEILFNASTQGNFFRIVNQTRLSGGIEEVTHLIVEYNLDLAMKLNSEFNPVEDCIKEVGQFVEEYGLAKFECLDTSVLPLEN